MKLHALPSLVLPLLLGSLASAQSLRWSEVGNYSTQNFGAAVSSLADTNGDGYRDILVGDPGANPGGSLTGEVHLLSGMDGSALYTISGTATSERMGVDVAGIQDVTGDGVEDFIVTSDNQQPQLRSGADGSWVRDLGVFSVPGGQVVEVLEDVDNDGWDEIIVGHPDFGSNHGQVVVLRGSYVATGAGAAVFWSRNGLSNLGFLGSDVANAGDVSGDGVDDVLAGAPVEMAPNGDCGVVYVLDGTNGSVIHALTLSSSCLGFGSQISTAGDWDGDGRADVLVGTLNDTTGGNSAGAVRIYSGLDGSLLFDRFGAPNDRLGRAVCGGIDVDADGREEILVGAHTEPCLSGRGTVHVIDPATQLNQASLCGGSDANLFGQRIEPLGDVDGDGQQDFSVTDPETVQTIEATVYVYGGDCLGYMERFCASTPNSAGTNATITATGPTSIAANSMSLIARACPPNKSGLFFYGTTQVMNALGDGWRCAGGMTFRLMPVVQTNNAGIVTRPLDFTTGNFASGPGAALPSGILNFQLWYRDPMGPGGTGFNFTDGVSVRFCP